MITSDISKLNNDILLTIFDILTLQLGIPDEYSKDPRPLTIIRAASQVCQDWRGLLLASPWIWGRLVDLDLKSNPHTPQEVEWLEEVVIRTGDSAPLWIYGHVKECSRDAGSQTEGVNANLLGVQSCFMRLLNSWERIERLSVHIDLNDKMSLRCIQDRFACRAPILKSFDVDLSGRLFANTLNSGSSQCLFADDAPLLQIIKADRVSYRLDSPWLSHIREIARLPERLTLQDLFTLLQHTPMLETIVIYSRNLALSDQPLPSFVDLEKIVLPSLSSMKFWANLPVFAAFLDRVSPGNLSALFLKVSDIQTENLDDAFILSSIKANLPTYLSSYFATNSFSKWVELSISGVDFLLRNVTEGGWRVQTFEVAINSLLSPEPWSSILVSVLDALTYALSGNPSAVEPVTELRLPRLDIRPGGFISELSITLTLFIHVQRIQTDGRVLHALCNIHQFVSVDKINGHPHILFPELHTLSLTAFGSGSCADLLLFAMARKNVGYPLARLDLTRCSTISRWGSGSALENLEVVHGLEVVWRKDWETRNMSEVDQDEICSYICGSGDPDQLKNLKMR